MIFDLVPGELYELVSELYCDDSTMIKLKKGNRVVVLSSILNEESEIKTAQATLLSPEHGKVNISLYFASETCKGTETWFKRIPREEKEENQT